MSLYNGVCYGPEELEAARQTKVKSLRKKNLPPSTDRKEKGPEGGPKKGKIEPRASRTAGSTSPITGSSTSGPNAPARPAGSGGNTTLPPINKSKNLRTTDTDGSSS